MRKRNCKSKKGLVGLQGESSASQVLEMVVIIMDTMVDITVDTKVGIMKRTEVRSDEITVEH